MNQTFHLPVDELHRFIQEVFVRLGVPADDALTCANVLILSDLHGIESHGIGRLKMYFDRIRQGIQQPVTNITVVSDRDAAAVWDGNHGMGHVIGHSAMRLAMDKARRYGLGSVVVRNSTHYGIAGYYAKMAANEDMVGITFTNARPSIAPTFSVTPMLGTNPICMGAPSDMDFPFLYDAATSITQRGKIEVLDRAHKPTPAGWAINENGEQTTDTSRLLEDLVRKTAALLPLGGAGELLGGHKGYGLATMVEILCAALQDGSYLHDLHGKKDGKPAPYCLGHFFLAINVAHFVQPEVFRRITGDIMRQLKAAQPAPGCGAIYVAGEKEYQSEQQVRRQGVPVNAELAANIRAMQRELGITWPALPENL